ncbi:unnamed protein product [Ambrosiozyma monospora]|uniref:Unnamed protein product n=1 Tax=Ambrosiozyma monospora TaxID=43982 RepID=A0A9W6YTJ8_AMBMO|nr:unnamed protein product [Ambrosiozyma monospora]
MIYNNASRIIRAGLLNSVRFNSTIVKPSLSPALIDLRIGKIINIKRHENADKLYVSQIQIEPTPTPTPTPNPTPTEQESTVTTAQAQAKTVQVCSGLVDFIPQSELLNSHVVLVMNLKPSKMRGVKSEAMLLAASNESQVAADATNETATEGDQVNANVNAKAQVQVELVNPPMSLPLGQQLFFKGYKPADCTNFKRLKSNKWVELAGFLKTDSDGRVIFDENSDGKSSAVLGSDLNDDVCVVKSLKNCQVR